MNSQVERGTTREMVHTIAFRVGVLERILQEPVLGSLEIRTDELVHVQLLQRQINDLCRYLNLPSAEPERTAKVETYTDDQQETWSVCECGTDVWKSYNYCPECGAKLDWSNDG